jgi:hypothetical protein
MSKTYSERIIGWAFAIMAVVAGWQIIPDKLSTLVIELGTTQGSFLYHALIDGGTPIILLIMAWIAVRFYEDILWRWLPQFGCKRGWYIYGLISERESTKTEIVGFFYLSHTLSGTKIIEGRAFYFGNGISLRGNWDAEVVWITKDKIQFVFTMRAVNPPTEAMPSLYDGYLSLSSTTYRSITGIESWEGYFNDLGDRRNVIGPVCSERLSSLKCWNSHKAEKILHKQAEKMIERCKSKLIRRAGITERKGSRISG